MPVQLRPAAGNAPGPNPETHAATRSDEEIGSNNYYLHWAFNSSAAFTGEHKVDFNCWQGADLLRTSPPRTPVNVGDVVGLDANESGITLDAAPLDTLAKEKKKQGLRKKRPNLSPRKDVHHPKLKSWAKIVELDGKSSALTGKITKLGEEIQSLEEEEEVLAEATSETEERKKACRRKRPAQRSGRKGIRRKGRTAGRQKQEGSRSQGRRRKDQESGYRKQEHRRSRSGNDGDHKQALEKDKPIVVGDKTISEEEKKLADEHKLIKEREPLVAPIYKWDFGYQENGKEVTEEGEEKASVFHTFPCAKTYTVELTVVDGGGNEQSLPAA